MVSVMCLLAKVKGKYLIIGVAHIHCNGFYFSLTCFFFFFSQFSFRSITALKYYIQTGLDSLEDSRRTLLDRLLQLDQTMENPRQEDVE